MKVHERLVPFLSLFSSLSTLVCCALPALLVSLGAGAVMASLVSAFPQLVWISEHKVWLFTFAGVLLVTSGTGRWLARNAPCPIDPAQAKACLRARQRGFSILCVSVVIWLIGFFFAFVAPYL